MARARARNLFVSLRPYRPRKEITVLKDQLPLSLPAGRISVGPESLLIGSQIFELGEFFILNNFKQKTLSD